MSLIALAEIYQQTLRAQADRTVATDALASLHGEMLDRAINEVSNADADQAMMTLSSLEHIKPNPLPASTRDAILAMSFIAAGHPENAISILENEWKNSSNLLAGSMLVWADFDTGRVSEAGNTHANVADQFAMAQTESNIYPAKNATFRDLTHLFLAYNQCYGPGDADQNAIDELSEIQSRHRNWGIVYAMRCSAYTDKFSRTKDPNDLRLAFVKFAGVFSDRHDDWYIDRRLTDFERIRKASTVHSKLRHCLLAFELNRPEEAGELLDEACDQAENNSNAWIGILMIDTLIHGRESSKKFAKKVLEMEDRRDMWEWHTHIVRYVAGDLAEEEMLKQAYPIAEPMSFAHLFAGVNELSRGHRESARNHFQTVIDTGIMGWGVYSWAKSFLSRMDEDLTWPAWSEPKN